MADKKPYADLDAIKITAPSERASSRRRARSPALSPGETRIEKSSGIKEQLLEKNQELRQERDSLQRSNDDLHQQLNAASVELSQVRQSGGSAEEVGRLAAELETLRAELAAKPVVTTRHMPVSGLEIDVRLLTVDPELCDVSDKNGRDQGLLDAGAVADILKSMRDSGQQVAGMGRPKAAGRYEVIDGSRRLLAAKIAGLQFQMWVGEVPDSDVMALSEAGNEHTQTSLWELAQLYRRAIDEGRYQDWDHLAKDKGFSRAKAFRLKNMVGIDRVFVRPFSNPIGLSQKFAQWLATQCKDSQRQKRLLEQARTLFDDKAHRLQSGDNLMEHEEIEKSLRGALKTTVRRQAASRPLKLSVDQSQYFSNAGQAFQLEARRMRGDKFKLELTGVSDTDIDALVASIASKLKLTKGKLE